MKTNTRYVLLQDGRIMSGILTETNGSLLVIQDLVGNHQRFSSRDVFESYTDALSEYAKRLRHESAMEIRNIRAATERLDSITATIAEVNHALLRNLK